MYIRREKHRFFILSSVFLGFLAGCSTAKRPASVSSLADDSNQALKTQILELQKSQSEQSSKIEELNNKILMLSGQAGKSTPAQAPKSDLAPPPAQGAPPAAAAVVPVAPVAEETNVKPLAPVPAPPREGAKPKKGITAVEKLYQQVVMNSKNAKLDLAGRDVNLMLKQFKNSPLTNNALYLYAETLYERGNYAKSAGEFERLYKLFPDGNKAVAALYKLALSYQKLGHPTEAQEAFENIVTVYPGSREALDAQNQIMNGNGETNKGGQ